MVIIAALAIIVCILSAIIIRTTLSLKRTAKELKELRHQDTNMLVGTAEGLGAQNELIAQINEVLKQLREERISYIRKSHALDMMVTNISHDLRTPLTSAKGYTQMIDDSMTKDEINDNIRIIENRLNRLNELIDSFFEFSKIISCGQPPERKMLDIVNLLEQSAAHYYDDLVRQGRKIEMSFSARPIMLYSNENMLMRIFDNLIGNACKHGEGVIKTEAVCEDGKTVIRFLNRTSAEYSDMGRLFDEFYTGDISRTGASTGLGLAIAKQFTQMLDGEIGAYMQGDWFVAECVFYNISSLKLNE